MSCCENKKANRYEQWEKKVLDAITALKANPTSKISYVAWAYGLSQQTLFNHYKGKTQAAQYAYTDA